MNVALLAAVLTVAAPQLKEKPAKIEPLLGRWSAQQIVIGGKDSTPGNEDLEYEFVANGQWIIYRNGKPLDGTRTWVCHPKARPAGIDLTEKKDGSPYPGIYEVDGDTLTVSIQTGGGERPRDFDAPPSGIMTVVMRRAPPK
jgi:uncharacterized protein (TIGR03067 family)